jgi:hypothetical protein
VKFHDHAEVDQVVSESYTLREAAERLGISLNALKSVRKRMLALDPSRPRRPAGRKPHRAA